MKKYFVLAIFMITSCLAVAQNYMDAIVSNGCKCMDGIPEDVTDPEELKMKLGLCIIEAAMPYKKQLKKDMGIDMDKIDQEGEKLGRTVGIKMVSVCPDAVMRMAKGVKQNTETDQVAELTVEGTITKVESDFFVTFSLKDESGKTSKYYWMTFVQGDDELVTNYATLVGKDVSITYRTQEFFDPKIAEYRKYFVISKIE